MGKKMSLSQAVSVDWGGRLPKRGIPRLIDLVIGACVHRGKYMEKRNQPLAAFIAGAAIGILGGLIGLGGAEFRLPLLLGMFGFGALEAVILNKAMSLVVVAAALPFRAGSVPLASIIGRIDIVLTLLAGSLIGAWFGASLATKLQSKALYRIIAALLLGIAAVLLWGHDPDINGASAIHGVSRAIVGVIAGIGIGAVASFLGVAGGELLIPTIVLLFGVDFKLAGSLSLAVSLPTMIVGFSRYSQDQSFAVVKHQGRFIATMAAGSLLGAFPGGRLLGIIPTAVLLPLLAVILIIS